MYVPTSSNTSVLFYIQMDLAITRERLTSKERNGMMDVTMNVSVRLDRQGNTSATTSKTLLFLHTRQEFLRD